MLQEYADQVCDLECTKKTPAHEFYGPIKIIFVDPCPEDYKKRIWGAASITLATLFIGINVVTVLFFAMTKTIESMYMRFHIAMGTIGFQLFMPVAILMSNNLFGPAEPLKRCHRKSQHFFLTTAAILWSTGSIGLVVLFCDYEYMDLLTPHGVSGAVSIGFAVIAALFSPLVCLASEKCGSIGTFMKRWHTIPAFISILAATVCFSTGLLKPSFKAWGNKVVDNLPIMMIAFCIIYTLVVLASPGLRVQTNQ